MASWLGKPGVDVYEDIQVNVLPLNSAFVILNTTFDRLGIYSVRDDCYKCPFEREHAFDSHLDNDYFMVDTKEPYTWRILKSNIKEYLEPDYRGGLICDLKPPVRGYGVYRLDVGTCGMETVKSVFFCLLGMVISGTAPRSMHTNISLFAPLPRIAVAYLMAATVYMFAKIRDPKAKTIVSKAWSNVKTLFWSWVLAVFLVAFMIISIALFYSTKCLLSPESELQGNWTSVSESLQCKDDIFGEVFNKNLLSVNRDEVFHVDYYYVFTKGLMGKLTSAAPKVSSHALMSCSESRAEGMLSLEMSVSHHTTIMTSCIL
ncbi:hypothetical protein MSG28_009389 [Choristoneura fumiferana]|uniref:Uncharacterized protein n=1 Tax=Choristoneura fumiferana TaxID=7141 RepID=A0ACC0KX64_CHOFU|nr:hypothetical protein MSG28_009389 [Choristoneura fumiferana]